MTKPNAKPHATSCVLNAVCKTANSPSCNRICPHYIALHGASGKGGRIGNANIPLDYANITLSNSPVKSEQPKAYDKAEIYVDTFSRMFDDNERIKSLYLYSEAPGTGKTTTAIAVLNEYLIRHYVGSLQRNRQPLERPIFFLDVNEWQTLYNEFNRSKVPEHIAEPAASRYYTWQKIAQSVPFLVMDDIGVREATEGFRADLHSIVNARVSNKLPIIYTSNLMIGELDGVFGEKRLADRVRDLTLEIPFEGGSKRGFRR